MVVLVKKIINITLNVFIELYLMMLIGYNLLYPFEFIRPELIQFCINKILEKMDLLVRQILE